MSSDPATRVAVAFDPAHPELAAHAAAIAADLGLPLCLDGTAGFDLCLVLTPQRLELRQAGPDAPGPVFADFVGGAAAHRRRYGGGRGQHLARAVGLRHGASPSVLDATAGLGRDAFVLADLGCRVTLVERSPVIAMLLRDALVRAVAAPEVSETAARMQLMLGDALALVGGLPEAQRPEVIYLDPMFPERSKSAEVKKEMRVFQRLVGADEDAPALLAAALAKARKRVVVKRPRLAPPLDGPKPSGSVQGKSTRFDIYAPHSGC